MLLEEDKWGHANLEVRRLKRYNKLFNLNIQVQGQKSTEDKELTFHATNLI